MSHVPPIEPSEPARDERPRPRYGEYAPASQMPPVVSPAPTSDPVFTPSAEVFHNAPPAKPKTLGVVAFVVGLVLLVFALVLSVVAGLAFAPLAGQMITDGGTIDQSALSADDPGVAPFSALSGAFFLGGTALGLWAIAQGIVAIITRRGRAFGIVALALAVATPVISFVVFYAVTFAAAPDIISSVS
jgi:hypothetical protein